MSDRKKIVVYTDLDGSLLDHSNYSYDAARDALDRLRRCDIPVVPVTSKTLDEINAYQELFADVPRVGENGMVIDLPEGYFGAAEFLVPGHSYRDIRAAINGLAPYLREKIYGFADMGIEGIMTHTGLSYDRAKLAHARRASEPFLWLGNTKQLGLLRNVLEAEGLKITQGGRFYHLMSAGGKDRALMILNDKFKVGSKNARIVSIALGDGPNDADMIGAATYGVRIPNAQGALFDVACPHGRLIDARFEGPKGWNDSIHSILDDLGIDR